LNEIKRELGQRSSSSTLKWVILRKDKVQRVKRCDGKLSNLLQTFEVCRRIGRQFHGSKGVTHRLQIALTMDARLEQIKINKSYQEQITNYKNYQERLAQRPVLAPKLAPAPAPKPARARDSCCDSCVLM
jgi:hypothetical protein